MYLGNSGDTQTVSLISTETKKPEYYTASIAIPTDSLSSENKKNQQETGCISDNMPFRHFSTSDILVVLGLGIHKSLLGFFVLMQTAG